jgi:hypothetical protein
MADELKRADPDRQHGGGLGSYQAPIIVSAGVLHGH